MSDGNGMAPGDLEQRLQGYLDGALSEAEAKKVAQLLEHSLEARRIFERLSQESRALRALFDAEAADMAARRPIDLARVQTRQAAERGAAWPSLPRRHWALTGAAAMAASLAVGVFLGGLLQPSPGTAPGWRMSAAVYHRLYSNETFASAPLAPAALAQGLKAAGAELGLDLTGLTPPEGLRLERAQLLRFNGRALAQLSFSRRDGAPIALCLMRRNGGAGADAPAFAASNLTDLTAIDWSDGAYDFLVLGREDAVSLRAVARRFAEQLG